MKDKAALRKAYKQARLALTEAEFAGKSAEIYARLLPWLANQSARGIHVYMPIEKHREVNTKPILEAIWSNPKQLAITSISDFFQLSMQSFLIHPDTEFQKDAWGIPSPIGAEGVAEKAIDIVIIPLLAFDLQGYRLGYGKGFYDRFLKICRKDVLKVGISLFEPEDSLPVDPHDVKMDFCFTPSQLFEF